MKILLCEDNNKDLNTIKNNIKTLECVEYVLTANDGSEALKIAKNNLFDLLITDIDMPKLSGLDLAQNIKNNINNDLLTIFITAYPKYSINSHQVRPIDFLVKPIDYSRLIESINIANDFLISKKINKHISIEDSIFTYKFRKSINMVNFDNILFFEKSGRSVNLCLDNDTLIKFYSDFQNIINRVPHYFFQSSSKYIINLKKVYRVVPSSRTHSEIFFTDSNLSAYLDKKKEVSFLSKYHTTKY
ncbi:LytR/AlgR family response regulator transcription factor [Peptostreptococcus equinus]|uniref:Stage 0 sporulation protein A homolog n=1 Tax=Peptostreptococcus equinus TaxID=3003601 RepID=A0ABY7JPT5_9FIRM|nr:LytTR family DNA-binding domain-containing protein [Peptostreptococcus sp. CBA3647]WAW14504.1 LytTR family DNA-binding domain-containing protein [Peptostreptococcus sp. CBA3647]